MVSGMDRDLSYRLIDEKLEEERLCCFNLKTGLIALCVVKIVLSFSAIAGGARAGLFGLLVIVCDVFGLIGVLSGKRGYLKGVIVMTKMGIAASYVVAVICIVATFSDDEDTAELRPALYVVIIMMVLIFAVNIWILKQLKRARRIMEGVYQIDIEEAEPEGTIP